VHGAAELAAAADAGADYAILAPVLRTASKPAAAELGVPAATSLTRAARLPVVWLGGLSTRSAALAFDGGAAGIAVMSAIAGAADPEAAARELVAAAGAAR
jgi:thiamine monophosphate synthase